MATLEGAGVAMRQWMMEHADQVAWDSPTGNRHGWVVGIHVGVKEETVRDEPKKVKRGSKGAVKGITIYG